jgi:hypothetical protein
MVPKLRASPAAWIVGTVLLVANLALVQRCFTRAPAESASNRVELPQFDGGGPSVEGLKAAADAAKQLITLSVGMIGLTVTFLEKIEQTTSTGHRDVSLAMALAWAFYVLAIIGALGTLLGVSGTLTTLDRAAMKLRLDPDRDTSFDVYSPTVRWPMFVMVIAFLLAIGATIWAAAFP